ncbi:MAG: nickel-responsive transcriptional regulator NikR [Synergistaceae bacterium]|nr:nickel-responsive transcriptional regulator NikR [Synergistaceae bacterium]MBR0093975.1 nickel-responsive transcriptional regulator NikR [Synergistaceae bacterium]
MPSESSKLVRFSVTVPENLLAEFESSYYAESRDNRSEAVRNLMREYISRERWKLGNREIFATITITYDHHMPELTGKLTAAQHDCGDVIICSTHVHINHETCLECVITKGLSDDIQKFIEALKNIRGVKSLNVNVSAEI